MSLESTTRKNAQAAGSIIAGGMTSASAASMGAHPLLILCLSVLVGSLVHSVPPIVDALREWSIARMRADAKAHGVEMERDRRESDRARERERLSGVDDSDRKAS